PDAEVIADVAPQPVKPLRFDDQKEDDQPAEQDQPQIGYRIQQVALREEEPAVILEKPARQDRQQGHENSAEDRAEDRDEPADDDHRQVIDRDGQLELLIIGDAQIIGVEHAGDPGVER